MSKKFAVLLSLLALLVVMVVPSFAQDGEEEELGTIVDIAVAASTADEPEFTILVAAVQAAGFADLLSSDGPFTVFAPTDEAFLALLEELGVTPEEVLADTETLTMILAYHVVPGVYYSADVINLEGAYLGTLLPGYALEITAEGIDDAGVVALDIAAANGVIHVIDSVLLPDMGDMEEME